MKEGPSLHLESEDQAGGVALLGSGVMVETRPADPLETSDAKRILIHLNQSIQALRNDVQELRGLKKLLQGKVDAIPARTMSLKEALPYMPPGARSLSSLRRLLKKGRFPKTRVNNRISINPAEVCAAFEQRLNPREAVREFLATSKGQRKPVAARQPRES